MVANYNQPEDHDFLQEKYDSQQVQKHIEHSDAWLETGVGIAQGTILAGFQMASVQSLYSIGAVGMFPMVVASLPVSLAFGVALNTITIDNGFSISDIGKFGAGLSRCGILIASSFKLHFDNQRVDKIASEGVKIIEKQVYNYEGKKLPENNNDLLFILVAAAVGIGAAIFFRRRK